MRGNKSERMVLEEVNGILTRVSWGEGGSRIVEKAVLGNTKILSSYFRYMFPKLFFL